MKRITLSLALLIALASASSVRTAVREPGQKTSPAQLSAVDQGSELLEIGDLPLPDQPAETATPATIKIVCYNIHFRGGEELQKIIEALRSDEEIGGAGIIGLQETDRNKKRSGNLNTAREIAKALGMNYVWAGQPPRNAGQKEEDTGVALLSRYRIADVERIVLPHRGFRGRLRVAVGATVMLGARTALVYVVHSERILPLDKKLDQLRVVIEAVNRRSQTGSAIVMGDFNSHMSVDETAELFTGGGFSTPIPNDGATWKLLFVTTKLDWIWLRSLTATGGGVTDRIKLSDHKPIWVTAKL
jgi:endonuclease/exonuclease/phosphatase family metal-dependent hydrolase